MRRFLFILSTIALLAISCTEESPKMPWEGQLGDENPPADSGGSDDNSGDNGGDSEGGTTTNPDALAAWSEGYFDIHTISTGRGECLLLIMPDGTSLVVDAGEFSRETSSYKNVAQRPSAAVRPSRTYAKYIKHFLPKIDSIDYFNLSHYHMDHMGNMEPEYLKDANGDYVLSGMTALYHYIPFRKIVDRAYPKFDTLNIKKSATESMENYKKFLQYNIKNRNLKIERFELGAVNQFAMRNNPSKYPTFSIDNVCANAYIWKDGKAKDICGTSRDRNENESSCGFVVHYGKFDFFTAGDIGDYYDYEYYVAQVAGDVDAAKASHHLSPHSMSEKTMNVMKPEVMSVASFYVRDIQPDKSKFEYITNGGCKLYCTSVGESLLTKYPEDYAKCEATSGHIVIRVEPNGDKYWVYVLDDTDSEYRIIKCDGPFNSK